MLLIEGPVEAVPGIWDSGRTSGLVLLAALEEDVLLAPGQAVAEVRAGLVHSEVCECGALDTSLIVPRAADRCGDCGALMLSESQRDACSSGTSWGRPSRGVGPACGPAQSAADGLAAGCWRPSSPCPPSQVAASRRPTSSGCWTVCQAASGGARGLLPGLQALAWRSVRRRRGRLSVHLGRQEGREMVFVGDLRSQEASCSIRGLE